MSLLVVEAMPGDGDLTDDGEANLENLPEFESCYTGPDVPLASACKAADMDGDGDVDLDDFALFQAAAG